MKTNHVYIGFDPIDSLAFQVAVRSIRKYRQGPVEIHPLREWELRHMGIFTRPHLVAGTGQKFDVQQGRAHSTEFTFTRWLTPYIHRIVKGRSGPALFIDADMMFRADIGELFNLFDSNCDVQVVKHDHKPEEATKIIGVVQQQYEKKNWASVMLFNPDRRVLYPDEVNTATRDHLYKFEWTVPSMIGGLPEEWNWLEGWSSPTLTAKNVHHTRGTPDMPDWAHVAYANEWWSYIKPEEKLEL